MNKIIELVNKLYKRDRSDEVKEIMQSGSFFNLKVERIIRDTPFRCYNSGGGNYLLEGDIKSVSNGYYVMITIGEEVGAIIMRNADDPEKYISSKIYNDEEIAEEKYWGYEYDLEERLITKPDGHSETMVNWNTARHLFSDQVIEELVTIVELYWEIVRYEREG